MQLNTFSIVAYAPQEQAWGVAVASKFLAAGALVSWARAGAGAVATQALARVSYGADGLDMMAQGQSAEDALQTLLALDPDRERRQVGLVDAHGGAAAHTGSGCSAWAGHRIGAGFTCQGNILTGPETLDAMAETFTAPTASWPIGWSRPCWRATRSGAIDAASSRPPSWSCGRGTATVAITTAILTCVSTTIPSRCAVWSPCWPCTTCSSASPGLRNAFRSMPRWRASLQALLRREGYYQGDASGVWDLPSQQAFWVLVGNENLEERWAIDDHPGEIDPVTLDYLRQRFKFD